MVCKVESSPAGLMPKYEMQQVLPGFDPDDLDDYDSEPIIQANELRELGEYEAAHQPYADV
ncbi:hypothetical protein IMCC3135_02835 [Granulosicoccus antarcticus IMCC3135]|uniref:Uncharacterized protein n=1 Tax=Granulosicoccus antarcticus IMCC3135 TaxID=1192854 RepID=A0A2Z2NPH8_9GAMM|nr:hypothetical protein IMCC3135_02835 [Granulosicoccus antarcticus IMCC3135]